RDDLVTGVQTCALPILHGSFLRLHVRFPDCWDGQNLDSADHKSHMAYALRGECPSTHPVAVPAVELIYRYPTLGGSEFSLSSMEIGRASCRESVAGGVG